MMWLPRCRAICQPSFSKIRTTSRRLIWEALASDGDPDLLSLNSQRHTAFRPHFQAQSYSFPDIGQRFFATRSLADTPRDRRTFSDPDAILVTIQRGQKFHAWHFTSWVISQQPDPSGAYAKRWPTSREAFG